MTQNVYCLRSSGIARSATLPDVACRRWLRTAITGENYGRSERTNLLNRQSFHPHEHNHRG